MSSDTLQAYRHSGKFTLPGLTLPIASAVVVGIPLGLAYAHLTRWIPFIYINILLALGYGFAVGWVVTKFVKLGMVRNVALATSSGVLAGCIALYAEWSGFIHAVWDDAPLLSTPTMVLAAMEFLYENGSWSLRGGNNVSGIMLGVVWLIEAGIIVGVTTMMTYHFVRSTPFCEKSKTWLDQEKAIDTLAAFDDAADLATLAAGDLQPVVAARPRSVGSNFHARLLLKQSPRSQHFCTLMVQNVSVSHDSNGKPTEKVVNLTGDLMIPPSFVDVITHLALLPASSNTSAAPV